MNTAATAPLLRIRGLDTGIGRAVTEVREFVMTRTDTSLRATVDLLPGDWLVFSDSMAGWRASIDGADLGEPVLVNGYAMGWPIDTAVSGELRIEWEAQRAVTGGLIAGGVAIVVVAWLALRRRPGSSPAAVSPSLAVGGPWGRRQVAVLVAITLGPAVIAAPFVARLTRPGRRWLLAAPFVAMWAWTSARQIRWDMPIDLRWPASMGWAQWLVLAVVAGCCWVALTDDE